MTDCTTCIVEHYKNPKNKQSTEHFRGGHRGHRRGRRGYRGGYSPYSYGYSPYSYGYQPYNYSPYRYVYTMNTPSESNKNNYSQITFTIASIALIVAFLSFKK